MTRPALCFCVCLFFVVVLMYVKSCMLCECLMVFDVYFFVGSYGCSERVRSRLCF